MRKVIVCLLILISSHIGFAAEDPNYLRYERADGSSEYYGDASGNRITREAYIELGKAQIQAMQNQVVAFAQNNQAAADSYGAKEAPKIMAAQAGVTENVISGLEKSKREFVKSIEAHTSTPTFQKALVSVEKTIREIKI